MGFPNLKRVTFTTKLWRSSAFPLLYNTPFHKSLPVGFRKPSISHVPPRPASPQQIQDRHPNSQSYFDLISAIADMQVPKVEEFVADIEGEELSHPCFLLPDDFSCTFTSKHVKDTVRMFQRTPLKYLKFFIITEMNTREESASGDIVVMNKTFLSHLHHLQHLDVSLKYNKINPYMDDPHRIPIPENIRQQLKTLTLRHIFSECDDIVQLLTSMPNLQHVTLHQLYQWRTDPSWYKLFERLKECYSKITADFPRKPSFTISQVLLADATCLHVVDQEVNEYLYGNDQENPFLEDPDRTFAVLRPQIGWRVDARDDSVRERMSEFCKRREGLEGVGEAV